jgi:hypothetical protein
MSPLQKDGVHGRHRIEGTVVTPFSITNTLLLWVPAFAGTTKVLRGFP